MIPHSLVTLRGYKPPIHGGGSDVSVDHFGTIVIVGWGKVAMKSPRIAIARVQSHQVTPPCPSRIRKIDRSVL